MRRSLYPYQKELVDYLISHDNPALWVEMRLGKTLSTIRAFNPLPGRKLVVCPKPVINTWCDELDMEGVNYGYGNTTDQRKIYRKVNENGISYWPQWMIFNYEAVMKMTEEEQKQFDYIILDESVRIKNPKAKITRFLLENFRDAKKRVCLSGNPAPNSPIEYYTQFQFLKGEWMGCENYWKFRKRYFASDLRGWQFWERKGTKESIRNQLQKDSFILTRKEVGVANQKVYEKRIVEMPPIVAKHYKKMEKEFVATLPDGQKLETRHVLAQLTYLQEMASGHIVNQEISNFKLKELKNLLEGELKGEQVLIWCRFRWEIDAIVNMFINKIDEFSICSITGDTSMQERKEKQERFNRKDSSILIMQIQTGRYGLNLSAADTCIYFSNTFSSDDRTQSEARIEHNEKKTPLLYIDLITKNSIEEDILKSLKKKKKNSDFFMDVVTGIKERVK